MRVFKHNNFVLRLSFLALQFFFATLIWAQTEGSSTEKSTTTTTTTSTSTGASAESHDWYTKPWIWIVGATVLILLLIAILSRGRRETVRTERTTVIKKDNDN